MRLHRYATILALVVAAAPQSVFAQQPGMDASVVGWLAGCWTQRVGGEVIEEQWLAPRAGILLGVSRTSRGDSLVGYEYMRIQARGGSLVFAAQPSGQPPVEFLASTVSRDEVVFENSANDFPQRIRYRRSGSDSLRARIEAPRGAETVGVNFGFARTACGSAPTTQPRGGREVPPPGPIRRTYDRGP